MVVSLTREQFVQRLAERKDLFLLALEHDLKRMPVKVKVLPSNEDPQNVYLDFREVKKSLEEIIGQLTYRQIDLVYEEGDWAD